MAIILEDEDERIEEAQEPQAEVTPEPTPEPEPEDDIPEKYRGKSAKDLVRMHQEAERVLGRQSAEVGELRKTVDSYIKTQLEKDAPKDDEDDVDFFVDPDKAVARAIERHPKIREAEQVTNQYRQQTAMAKLQQKHPDMQKILNDQRFSAWIQESKIRTQLFRQADQQYDSDAADELFTMWKERQAMMMKTAAAEKSSRSQTVKAANTGNVRGNPDGNTRKIYRRSDIIKLMQEDPSRYEAMSDEIMRAYAEGRVK